MFSLHSISDIFLAFWQVWILFPLHWTGWMTLGNPSLVLILQYGHNVMFVHHASYWFFHSIAHHRTLSCLSTSTRENFHYSFFSDVRKLGTLHQCGLCPIFFMKISFLRWKICTFHNTRTSDNAIQIHCTGPWLLFVALMFNVGHTWLTVEIRSITTVSLIIPQVVRISWSFNLLWTREDILLLMPCILPFLHCLNQKKLLKWELCLQLPHNCLEFQCFRANN